MVVAFCQLNIIRIGGQGPRHGTTLELELQCCGDSQIVASATASVSVASSPAKAVALAVMLIMVVHAELDLQRIVQLAPSEVPGCSDELHAGG